jgi:hypothetical protein
MKSAKGLLADIVKRSRLAEGNMILLLEQSPKAPGDPNWHSSAAGAFYPDTLGRYNSAVAELRQEHPLVNWEGVTDRIDQWRRIAIHTDENLFLIADPSEMDLDQAFEALARAMVIAANERRVGKAEVLAERLGLVKLGDGTPYQITDWERTDQGRSLRLRWRRHDHSQAFSIRPGMNILTIELRSGDEIVQRAEQRYED